MTSSDITIPTQADWTDHGQIFKAGTEGEWDYYLSGGFAGTVIKKNGSFYLYYQGASDYDYVNDTVMWRAIGVATSADGINFTKYAGNPIVTWIPNNEGEEGATSATATVDDDGEIVLYYGANTAYSPTLVHADGRLATSVDGINFIDRDIVLNHEDLSIWGSGDELFPILTIHDTDRWFIYYLPNGSLQSRKLGVAWGNASDNLTNSAGTSSEFARIQAWGMGGSAKIGPELYALFLNDVTKRQSEVRIVSLRTPTELSTPIETYLFDEVYQSTVFLDEETSTWFMFYRGDGFYGVKTAPAFDSMQIR